MRDPPPPPNRISMRSKWEKVKGINRSSVAESRRFLHLFLLIIDRLWQAKGLGVAEFRRNKQQTAESRRRPQEAADFCRNRLPVSPI